MARALDAEERALWQRAMRGVRRYGAPPARIPEPPRMVPPEPALNLPGAYKIARAAATRMDRRSANRLRRGRMPIEARLDLHGMSEDEAHHALRRFLDRALEHGFRAVLVVTGKGSGVLRSGVQRWLAEPALGALVIAVAEAGPSHGGEGAQYLLLRRKR